MHVDQRIRTGSGGVTVSLCREEEDRERGTEERITGTAKQLSITSSPHLPKNNPIAADNRLGTHVLYIYKRRTDFSKH